MKSFLLWYYSIRPFKKVVLVGCSYAGALVGWFAENESQFMQNNKQEPLPFKVAAWSSSGVMRPLEEHWGYDETIYQQLIKSGPQCVEQAQKLTKDVENVLVKNGTEREQALSIIGAKPEAKTGDILFYVADSIAITVQYANRTGLCKMLDGFQNKNLPE